MKLSLKKSLIAAAMVCTIGGGIWYYTSVYERGPVYDFNEKRDTQAILDIFKSDWYWLISSDDYSPEFMLKNRAPNNREPEYIGKLRIKVLRENDQFVGFAAYYMKSKYVGYLLFIAIKTELRGKRYGETLIRYVLNDLQHMGAQKIQLVTRTNNLRGQGLYNRVGFVEVGRDDEFVYFEYTPAV
jgi:ribosomal protein S18 acetylase RimI-like enzyme